LLIHHIHQEVFRKHLRPPFSWLAMFLEAKLMPYIYRRQTIITVSNSSKKEILRLKLGNEETIEVINPGINLTQFLKLKKTTYPSYLYLGRLQDYKNIDIAIKAFAQVAKKHPEAILTIAGFGEAQKKLKILVSELRLEDQVHFAGKVSEEEKNRLMATSWVFVQPSMLEGWGITVIEANASSTPVIASNVNGLKDSVSDLYSGFLVYPKDVSGFAEAMLDLAENTRLRNKLSKQALLWSRKFDWEISAKQFQEIIQNNLKKNSVFLKKFNIVTVESFS
jgi:glycosyltransferase involved in cell wall biosynthesis